MSRKSNPQTSAARFAIEIFPHPTHFFGRSGKAMNKQDARFIAGQEKRFGCRNGLSVHGLIIPSAVMNCAFLKLNLNSRFTYSAQDGIPAAEDSDESNFRYAGSLLPQPVGAC